MAETNWKALADFFTADEIEWRLQQAGEKNGKIWGLCIPYVTNRAIMQRLDDVCGPVNWKNEFKAGPAGGVLCGISIRVGEEWVTKWDGAENTDIEGTKGGLSGSMKRAAVQWGIGRYLYALEESFANVNENGSLRGKTKDGKPFKWDPPQLPAWALPKKAEKATRNGNGADAEHAAMLDFIRTVGPNVGDGEVGEVDRKEVVLKEFVRERWADIKDQPVLARAVVEALEKATGTTFAREAT